ncbi:hypothetical protein [Halalkalibacterium ligniniphilum]|uniref:hypothetical protein n=1 Tax=Halalkalibacterium ligniniphilum TaxID=1134413 RepID=UPI0003489089|nr:hypothetical protein [Halalkalibacterium ligniniphilum]
MSHHHHLKAYCEQFKHKMVQVQMNDHGHYQGYLEHVDEESIHLIVPTYGAYHHLGEMQGMHDSQPGHVGAPLQSMVQRSQDERFFPYYPPYSYYPYGYGWGWGRLILPLAALTAIAALY